jgi:hypothetical protein
MSASLGSTFGLIDDYRRKILAYVRGEPTNACKNRKVPKCWNFRDNVRRLESTMRASEQAYLTPSVTDIREAPMADGILTFGDGQVIFVTQCLWKATNKI